MIGSHAVRSLQTHRGACSAGAVSRVVDLASDAVRIGDRARAAAVDNRAARALRPGGAARSAAAFPRLASLVDRRRIVPDFGRDAAPAVADADPARAVAAVGGAVRSEEHTSELQSRQY